MSSQLDKQQQQPADKLSGARGDGSGRTLAKEELERWEHSKKQQKTIDGLRAREKALLER